MACYQIKGIYTFGQEPAHSVAKVINPVLSLTGYNSTYLKTQWPGLRVDHARAGPMKIELRSFDAYGNAAVLRKPGIKGPFNKSTLKTKFEGVRRPVPRIATAQEEQKMLEDSSEAVDKLEPTNELVTIDEMKEKLMEFQKATVDDFAKEESSMLLQEVLKLEALNRELNPQEQNLLDLISQRFDALLQNNGLPAGKQQLMADEDYKRTRTATINYQRAASSSTNGRVFKEDLRSAW